MALTTHPHLGPRFKNEQNYTTTLPLYLRGRLQDEYSNLIKMWNKMQSHISLPEKTLLLRPFKRSAVNEPRCSSKV